MNRATQSISRPAYGAGGPLGLAVVLIATLWTASPAEAGADTRGFLYGKVTTRSGSTFQGRLRWANEEAFWGDFFNSTKTERTMPDVMPKESRRRESIRIFGFTIGMRSSYSGSSRTFKTRFGDIDTIRVGRGSEVVLVMKGGAEYRLEGGSNDIGARIQIWDAGLGEVELDWNKIDTIQFLPAPKNLEVGAFRLHGTVHTSSGEFTGFIQWDQDECLSTDKLDGDTRDADLSLEMGRLRSIERAGNKSRVTLRDDREFVLGGSNDVDSSNRGVFVEDPRYGRVLVTWDAFRRIDFSEPRDSGRAYGEYKAGKPLRGSVQTLDGVTHRGRIAYDLDETQSWEILDGNRRDVEYAIPFELIAAVVPATRDSATIVLRSGEEIVLEGESDAGEGNAGILVFDDDGKERGYVPWDEVKRIDFDR